LGCYIAIKSRNWTFGCIVFSSLAAELAADPTEANDKTSVADATADAAAAIAAAVVAEL
jgi:hypothetical protein